MFENIKKYWEGLAQGARMGIAVGAVAIVALTVLLSYWALRDTDQVLFSGLSPQDGSAIVAELERMKVPYRLADDGSKILVEEEVVYKTRLKLMGKGVPIQGGVGFEVFDNNDFGMTEFAQKINYQRALQGELARTIMAFDEVKFARVHLVMPETSIFKQNKVPTKASVTLLMKENGRLTPEQVVGIQRLVAAAVSGLDANMVTVLDQRGVTLTRNSDSQSEHAAASGRLETKKEVETYLTRKLVDVLDKTFGPNQAIVSVDVTLNLDQVKTTQEDVIPLANNRGEMTGAVTRKKSTVQGGSGTGDGDYSEKGRNTTTEVEYQLGRKVQQVVETPGNIRRLSVGVLVPRDMDEAKLTKLREVVSMTIGLNAARGDAIALHAVGQFMDTKSNAEHLGASSGSPKVRTAAAPWWQTMFDEPLWTGLAITAFIALVLVAMVMRARVAAPSLAELTPQQREQVLAQIKQWLASEQKTDRESI